MSLVCGDENERLVAEQAVLAYREVHKAMLAAPYGQGLACTEAAVLVQGREQQRRMLELLLGGHPEAQKKGGVPDPAPAEVRRRSGTTRPKP
ncbi:MAG: hypothetical protein AAB385_02440 [Planctomycetota bacterium]